MGAAIFLVSFLIVTAPAEAQRERHGIFFEWGAFEERNPAKCFAMARAMPRYGRKEQPAFAAIGFWPERGVRGQVHVRLSRVAREGATAILRIDDRSFLLTARGADAWASGAREDAAILAAMRTGVAMTVESRSRTGSLFRDRYRLRGAASAIDAAAIACAPPPPR